MELKDLSCNWKKLQATFKDGPSKALKRKAGEGALQARHQGPKRPKTGDRKDKNSPVSKQPKPKEQNMGLVSSKELPSASLALWAEDNDISAKDLAEAYGTSVKDPSLPFTLASATEAGRINEGLSVTAEPGKYIAIDCEMVGVGPTPDRESALARVSIVNYHGHQLYDSFVVPKEPVTDYRTHVSGITPQLLRLARTLDTVQADVAELLDGRIIVGHAVRHDLDALLLGHPKRDIRDTSKYPQFRQYSAGRTPSLKRLASEVLGVDIQGGEHSSVEDARAAMLLYRREKDGFEMEHARKWTPHKAPSTKGHDAMAARKRKRKRPKK